MQSGLSDMIIFFTVTQSHYTDKAIRMTGYLRLSLTISFGFPPQLFLKCCSNIGVSGSQKASSFGVYGKGSRHRREPGEVHPKIEA